MNRLNKKTYLPYPIILFNRHSELLFYLSFLAPLMCSMYIKANLRTLEVRAFFPNILLLI